jgi:hypothetical protein
MLLVLSGMACAAQTAGAQSGAMGSAWTDAAKMPDLFTGMWGTLSSFVEEDARLNVPYTAKAQKFADTFVYKRDIPYAGEGCTTPGLPISMRTGPIKFTYAPGLISVYMQNVGDSRFIRMNEKMGKTSPKYYGNSVGHWEGDTLVVESEDFLPEITFQYGVGKGAPGTATGGAAPGAARSAGPASAGPIVAGDVVGGSGVAALAKAIWGPHSEGMRMVERMRLVSPNTLEIQTTVYDDTVWTKPYVGATRSYKRLQKGISETRSWNGEPSEWVCTVSITSFDPETNTYHDKDPAEMVKYLDKLGR